MSCEFEKDYVICGFRGGKIPKDSDKWLKKVEELKRRELKKLEKAECREECKSGWRR